MKYLKSKKKLGRPKNKVLHKEYERQMQIKSAETEDYKISLFALNEKEDF